MFMSFSNRYTLNNINDEREVGRGHVLIQFLFFILVKSYQRMKERRVIRTLDHISKMVRKITDLI
jgi:hypothetical protein